jgi:hypothetical protein
MSYAPFVVEIARHRVTFTGAGVVGPSVSTFYSLVADVSVNNAALKTFYDAVAVQLASPMQLTVQESGDTLESTNGDLVDTWIATGTGGTTNTTGSTDFSLGVGARVKWLTGGTFHGRRVVGSTFLVPLGAPAFAGAGALATGFINVALPAAQTLVANSSLLIWSRPGPGASDGEVNQVTAAQVPDAVSWLRSRRI